MTWDVWEVLLRFFRWICQYVALEALLRLRNGVTLRYASSYANQTTIGFAHDIREEAKITKIPTIFKTMVGSFLSTVSIQ